MKFLWPEVVTGRVVTGTSSHGDWRLSMSVGAKAPDPIAPPEVTQRLKAFACGSFEERIRA